MIKKNRYTKLKQMSEKKSTKRNILPVFKVTTALPGGPNSTVFAMT
jgi:hypothetical protein